jgi:hypothetical protein
MRMLGTQRFSTCFHMFPHVSTCQGPHIGHRSFPKEVRASHSPFAVKKPTPRVGMVLLPCPVAAWSWSRWVCLQKKLSRPSFPYRFSGEVPGYPFHLKKHFWNEALGNDVPHITSRPKTQQKNSILPQSCPPARPLNPPVQHHCPHYFDAITWVKI